MLSVYVFSLVLGGGLLLISVLGDAFGGDAGDLEMGTDVDFDMDMDMDMDVDMDADVDADGGPASKILSMRTLTYALFGFGAVGSLLSWLGFSPVSPPTIAFSLGGGLAAGAAVSAAFHYLAVTDTGALPGDRSLVGLPGRVSLPLGDSSPGRIVVERGSRRLTLRALPLPSESETRPVEEWRSVVIVDMENGVARVTPVAEDLTTTDE